MFYSISQPSQASSLTTSKSKRSQMQKTCVKYNYMQHSNTQQLMQQ